MLYLRFLNSRQSNKRVTVGKSAVVLDESMMRKIDLAQLGKGVNQAAGPREEDKAFADITDLKNEDFIFVY